AALLKSATAGLLQPLSLSSISTASEEDTPSMLSRSTTRLSHLPLSSPMLLLAAMADSAWRGLALCCASNCSIYLLKLVDSSTALNCVFSTSAALGATSGEELSKLLNAATCS